MDFLQDFSNKIISFSTSPLGSLITKLGRVVVRSFLPNDQNILLDLTVGSVIFVLILFFLIFLIAKILHRRKIYRLTSSRDSITPKEFFYLYNSHSLNNFAGVYVIHNLDRDLYYVGQSIHVLTRLNQHFTGHGNGDVYADYKYGNAFEIMMISLQNSRFSSLNSLEKEAIQFYHAYDKGYNKTRGNRG